MVCSDSFDSQNDEDIQPVAKKAKAADHQTTIADFVDKAGPSKIKPRAVSNAKTTSKKKPVESDLEENSLQSVPLPPPREAPPKRTARVKAKKYIEVESDSGDEKEQQDETFVISD